MLQKAIDQCTNLSGNQEDCPVFTFPDGTGECQMESPLPGPISKENVLGPRKGLPNGIQVPGNSGSDGYAAIGKPFAAGPPPSETVSVAKVPTVAVSNSHTSSTASASQLIDLAAGKNGVVQVSSSSSTLLPPAQIDVAARPSTFATSSSAPPASSSSPTTTSAPASTQIPQAEPETTSYYTLGREAHEVVVYVEEVTVTADVAYAKRTAAPEPKGKIEHHHRRHMHGHMHHAGRGIGGQRRR